MRNILSDLQVKTITAIKNRAVVCFLTIITQLILLNTIMNHQLGMCNCKTIIRNYKLLERRLGVTIRSPSVYGLFKDLTSSTYSKEYQTQDEDMY